MHDANEMFSDNQSLVTGAIGAVLSSKSLDMWNGARQTTVLGNTPSMDLGRGQVPELVVRVGTAAVSGGGGTLIVELVQADDEALTTNLQSLQQAPGNSVTVGYSAATLVSGYPIRLAIPPNITKRYLGVRYNILTAVFTALTVNAFLAREQATAPGII